MAYATVDDLALALNKQPATPELTAAYQACLDAAAEEIDHYADRRTGEPIPDDNALANRVNILRAVEWWKSNAAAFGVIGMAETGSLLAPRDSFARHRGSLLPLKQQWGLA